MAESRPGRDQRGLTESVQYAVLWPVLLLVTLGIIQTGIWLHARNTAQRAATVAVDLARGAEGTSSEAEQQASLIAEGAGLEQVSVRLVQSATEVTAVVSATAPLIFDVGLGRLTETAAAPRERLTVP